jgi:(4S)-4-hydroxy-5-phosphonooxypentane-2,3-dione isomerase
MHVLLVEFVVKPQHVAAFEAEMAANALTSLKAEPGCRQFDVCRDPADPALFVLYERYDDEAAVQAHLRSAHFLRMNERTADWVAHKSVRRLAQG